MEKAQYSCQCLGHVETITGVSTTTAESARPNIAYLGKVVIEVVFM